MAPQIVKWATGRKLHEALQNLKFLNGYKPINEDLAELYTHLKSYVHKNYTDDWAVREAYGTESEGFTEWLEYLDKLAEFQVFVRDNEDSASDEISKRASDLFGNKNVYGAVALELIEIDRLKLLLDYSESVRNLFNYVLPLVEGEDLSFELEQEIREVLDHKGLADFKVPEELLINNTITQTPVLS